MNNKTTIALILSVIFISGGIVFQARGKESIEHQSSSGDSRKTFQIDVQTSNRWIPTQTPEQRKAAACNAITAYFKAVTDKDLDKIVQLSGIPFWMDGFLIDSEAVLRSRLEPQLGFEFEPNEFIVEEDFSQLARETNYPMNGMLLRVSDGNTGMSISIGFGRSVEIIGFD
jgi:hypothetical protein